MHTDTERRHLREWREGERERETVRVKRLQLNKLNKDTMI